jgi:hypothetical protein
VSDETPDKSAAPGTTAADDAPTAAVPRIPKPDKGPAAAKRPGPAAAKPAGNRPASAKPASASPAPPKPAQNKPAPEVSAANPGKPAGAESAPEAKASPEPEEGSSTRMTFSERVAASVPSSLRNPKATADAAPGTADGVTAVSRPVTAGEYARTNEPSASATAVIPAVRDDAPKSSGAAAAAAAASGRQASLKLVRVDPWSVTKVVFALTVALMIVAVVAITILWIVLSFAGVWDQINSSVTTVLSDESNSFDITEYLGFGRIVGLTLVISAINVVITTAVATIGAYLYNLAAQLLGGFDITLAEDN